MFSFRFTLIVLGWFPFISFAQTSQKKYSVKKENIVFHKGDTVIQVSASSAFTKKRLHADRKYYWYRQHNVYQTTGGYDGRLLHGTYEKFNPKSNLVEKGEFRYGLKRGKWMVWKPNGDIESIAYWKNGIEYTPKETFFKRGYKKGMALFRKKKKQRPPSPPKVLTQQDTTITK